ncbi:hypothetical protein F442_09474 [Phytophthora nicotianae P10297]|uniref:Uncharacterized protein n=2 Tax=Phytophthora nicotianae TaxID=4792 RepID=W2ZCF9_PHYNI|nr:hypothetical protein L916_09268 [Phytophthora nicotianae]ETP43879.1 hypothetical protein F442_09474 [Phytophthora nicotianae P10297]
MALSHRLIRRYGHVLALTQKRDFWKFLQERKGYVENNPGFPLAKYQDGIVDAGGEPFQQKAHP